MKKLLFTLLLPTLCCTAAWSQIHTFRFVPGNDMFYIPWQGNDVQLSELYQIVDRYRAEITSGEMPVYVDSYAASMRLTERNRQLAFIRANRVKSELITQKGLVEDNFITKNYITPYTDPQGAIYKDIVIVTLHLPTAGKVPEPAGKVPEPGFHADEEPQPEKEVAVTQPQPVIEEEPQPRPQETPAPAPRRRHIFNIRTNLLYDAFLLPTLGIEWRPSDRLGIKVDGSYSFWGNEHGRVQKVWLVSLEVRWYLGEARRLYAGVAANVGEFNIYKGLIGNMVSSDTGYQGTIRGGGLTVGYQLPLGRSFAIDFNLGLGYTRMEYNTFTMSNEIRVYKDRNRSKNIWGPTQAGITLVWLIGGR